MSANLIPAAVDGQQNGFTQVPNHILHNAALSYGAKALYSILLSYCWHKDTCFPSYETLMREMQCHSQALSSFLKELATYGLITIIRRGQGKTNLYQLKEVVQPAPEPTQTQLEQTMETRAGEEEACSLKIKEQDLRTSKTEEYKEEKYEGRYHSSIRTGKTSGEGYVNFQRPSVKQQDSTTLPHQTRVEQYRTKSSTTAQNIEEVEQHKNNAPAPRQKRLVRDNTLDMYDDIQRGLLLEYITDFAREFNDQAPLKSSTTRAYSLFKQSGVSMETFIDYLYSARLTTKERTANIRKMTEHGLKTKMAYFFAVLEDRLGLRPAKSVGYASRSP